MKGNYMKVLWSVNTILPDVAKAFGLQHGHAISWVDAMRTALAQRHPEISLAIVCNGDTQVKTLVKKQYEGVMYYIMPANGKYKQYWAEIMSEFSPDVIHAYGTEKKHNIPLIENYARQIPIVISLQGLLSEYHRHYYAFIPKREILLNYTLRDFLRGGILAGKRRFIKQSKYERKMLCDVKYVEGRSDWDKAISTNINPALTYYHCPRMIRQPFFSYEWQEEQIEPHSLFVHQGNYPIKGLHFMLDALGILSRKYPDMKLYISGGNILNGSKLREGGYTRYIRKKIRDLGLEDRIVFTGYLNADALAERLSRTHVCVIPSAIENAPNSLAEAMIVGTPCVASHVGGNAEMMDYGRLGLLYCYYEPQLLAERIERLFETPDLARSFSALGREYTRKKHDPEHLEHTLLDIYRDMIRTASESGGRGTPESP